MRPPFGGSTSLVWDLRMSWFSSRISVTVLDIRSPLGTAVWWSSSWVSHTGAPILLVAAARSVCQKYLSSPTLRNAV